jgi:hypothetical protein
MADRAETIAAFIRIGRGADRLSLACGILSRWPDVTGAELQRAIDLATSRSEGGRLARALEPLSRHQSGVRHG